MVCRLLFFYSLLLYKERSWVLGLQLSVAKILQNPVQGFASWLSVGGVRQDHVWCFFAESAIIFPIDFVWKLEPAISLSLYPVWRMLLLN